LECIVHDFVAITPSSVGLIKKKSNFFTNMKLTVTVVALLLGISSHALAAIPLSGEELDERPSLRGFDPAFIEETRNRNPHNPHNCPMPSEHTLAVNPCFHAKQTICCQGPSLVWVQCFRPCLSSLPADTSDGTSSFNSEDFASEDYEDFASESENHDAVDAMAES
jgi:hypothetical protein